MSKRIKSFEALNKLVTQKINKPDVINKSKKTSTQNSVLNKLYKYREVEGIPIYTEKEYQEEKRRNIEYSKTINRTNRNKKEEQDKELREKRREEFEPIIKTYNINSLYHFTDLENIVRICGRAGASVIGLNPLNVLMHNFPENASPYSSIVAGGIFMCSASWRMRLRAMKGFSTLSTPPTHPPGQMFSSTKSVPSSLPSLISFKSPKTFLFPEQCM